MEHALLVLYASIALALVILAVWGLSWLLARPRRREARALPPPTEPAFTVSGVTESVVPFSDGAKSAAKAGTAREQRTLEILDRAQLCRCLYCESHASRQIPQLKLIRSPFDRVYLWLNVVPANRWAIDLSPDISVPFLVCGQHHAIARSHLEHRIAENQMDYAAFVERKRHEMYEFVNYALDERMLTDANSIKRGKRKEPKAPPAEAPPRLSLAKQQKDSAA